MPDKTESPATPGPIHEPAPARQRGRPRRSERVWMWPFPPFGLPPWIVRGRGDAKPLPSVDIIDRDTQVVVRAEVPGLDRDTLDVSVDDHTLTIKGQFGDETVLAESAYLLHETISGPFVRVIALPASVDVGGVSAKCDKGLLEITLPKRKGAQRRGIDIV